MDGFNYLSNLPVIVPETTPSEISINEKYLVYSVGERDVKNTIEVWVLAPPKRFLLDAGFEKNICALELGAASRGSPLCVATKERVVFWNSLDDDPIQSPIQLGEELGYSQHIAFEPDTNSLISICFEKNILIFELQNCRPFVQVFELFTFHVNFSCVVRRTLFQCERVCFLSWKVTSIAFCFRFVSFYLFF